VQPGGEARLPLTITNTGTRVEGYELEVLGPTAPWARVEPPQISVYPQESGAATVAFSPPGGTAVLGGWHPFGVIARSTLDPSFTAITEGDIEVEKVPGLQAKIVPVTSAGRWRGQHVIPLSNKGNTAAHLRISASDPDDAIGFYLSPATLTLPPGGQATVRLSALARRPFLRGMAVRLPFEVVAEPADRPPNTGRQGGGYGDLSRQVVAAAFTQKPILSAGLVSLLVALLVALVAIGTYLQLRPEPPEVALAARDAPARPALTVTQTGPTSVRVGWDPVESADGYQLEQTDRAGNVLREFERFSDVNVRDITDLAPATEACFRLRASRGAVPGPWSGTTCATTALAGAQTATPSASASSVSSSSASLPPRDPLPTLVATRGKVTIDGRSSDWTMQLLAVANKPIAGSTSVSADIYLMWDVDALYLLAYVHDGSVNSPDPLDLTKVYRGDAVILELGPDNRALAATDLARPLDAYYMFGLPTPLGPLPGATTKARAMMPGPTIIGVLGPNPSATSFDSPLKVPGITAATSLVADGYILEARIPWASIGLKGIAPNATLAANVVVSDRTPESLANRGMVSTNQQRTVGLRAHPYYWQQLRLLP